MIWFCYFSEKFFFLFWVWLMGPHFLHKLGGKWQFIRGFSKNFSELATGFQSEFLIVLIEFP